MTDYSAVWWRVKASGGHPQISGQQAGSGLCGAAVAERFRMGYEFTEELQHPRRTRSWKNNKERGATAL